MQLTKKTDTGAAEQHPSTHTAGGPGLAHSVADRRGSRNGVIAVLSATTIICSVLSHIVAALLGFGNPGASYRRIGPETGPQVFCAGSSLLQFGIDWPEVSEVLGQGIENWGVGNSSPDIWEISQSQAHASNLMIVGVSVYDLNEYHLCSSRPHFVSLSQTVHDLWATDSDWQFSKRVLSQYPLYWLQRVFPTAGNSDAVLEGLRRKFLVLSKAGPTSEEQGNALVLPTGPLLKFGGSTAKVTDWSEARRLRRLAVQRNEISGRHLFVGPKSLALERMIKHAEQSGRAVVVVMPISPSYAKEFLTSTVAEEFDQAIDRLSQNFPRAYIIRLDRLAALKSDELFSDLVHLNGAGREIANAAFITELASINRSK